MKGDFSRLTFRDRRHYRGVLQQQGRVQLDADWNEQVLLQAHLDRLTAWDTVGLHGAPMDAAGMQIVDKQGQPLGGPADVDELHISPGRYYVSGVLCENEDLVALNAQPDLPGVTLPEQNGKYVAYLDVWHQHLTAREEPDLREVALGGPDTTTRSRTVWQVQVRAADQDLPPALGSGRLRARARAVEDITDVCDAPTGTGYRRLDNQLYRVEIRNNGDADEALFLWSRENGSVTARLVAVDGDVLTLDSAGRDDRLAFDKGWVEVTSRSRALGGELSFFGSIGHVQDATVTVAEWWDDVAPATLAELGDDPIVRRWESGPTLVTLPANDDDWISLESGVQVQFADAVFRKGNYWLIPARTANLEGVPAVAGLAGDVDWPQAGGEPAFQFPAGIQHYYADIADLEFDGKGWVITDQRPIFPPLTGLAGDVAVGYAGGDGQQVAPGEALPQPLEVSVTRRGAPIPGAVVRFDAFDADGRLAPTAAELPASVVHMLDLATDPNGVAHCWWLPADDPARPGQRAMARWIGPGGQPVEPRIDFSVAFTVDEGPGVLGAVLLDSGLPLPNDAQVGAADLAGGMAVVLPADQDLAAWAGKPVLTVTLDIPTPLSEADRNLWGGAAVVGTIPVTVAGDVRVAELHEGSAVTWTPTEPGQQWLRALVGTLIKLEASDRVLGHIALDGRVTGRPDWHQWFWLVSAIGELRLLPHRARKLNLPSGRQLIAHATSRDALRAALPAGATLADGPEPDLEAARRDAGNAFRNGAPRELTLVAAAPYARTAEVIRDALAGFEVNVDVVSVTDLVGDVGARLAAGEPVDGLLTDDTQLAAVIAALPDFPEGFSL